MQTSDQTTHPSILLVTPRDHRLLALKAYTWVKGESWLDKNRITRGAGYGDVGPVLEDMGAADGRLGAELDIMPVGVHSKLAAILSGFDFVDISRIVLGQRKISIAAQHNAFKAGFSAHLDRLVIVFDHPLVGRSIAATVFDE